MKGYPNLTQKQLRIVKKHSLFDVFADWALSKKQKAQLAEDIAFIKEYRKERKAKRDLESQKTGKS